MLSFIEYTIQSNFDEDIGLELAKDLLPKKVLHWLKRVLHRNKYIALLKLQHTMLKDKSRNLSPHDALIKAAGVYGISGREIQKVMDKKTRYA